MRIGVQCAFVACTKHLVPCNAYVVIFAILKEREKREKEREGVCAIMITVLYRYKCDENCEVILSSTTAALAHSFN